MNVSDIVLHYKKEMMKKLIIILLSIVTVGCTANINSCKTYSYKKKPNISTDQYFPLKTVKDIFGNKVYRSWELNNKK